MRLAQAFGDG